MRLYELAGMQSNGELDLYHFTFYDFLRNSQEIKKKSMKIKPCPFCGASHISIYDRDLYRIHLECDVCEIQCSGSYAETIEEVIEKWNIRDLEELKKLDQPHSKYWHDRYVEALRDIDKAKNLMNDVNFLKEQLKKLSKKGS